MNHSKTRITFFIISIIVIGLFLFGSLANATMYVNSIRISLSQNFDGEEDSYGFGISGIIDENFSYILLKGPDPDGPSEPLEPNVLADSRYHEFVSPNAENNYRFMLWAGPWGFPSTGFYTVEIYLNETDSDPVYTKSIDVAERHIPLDTPVITYPTPSSFFSVLPLSIMWEPYPIFEDETISYLFEIFGVGDNDFNFSASTGCGTFGAYNGSIQKGNYNVFVHAFATYIPVENIDFAYIRCGNRFASIGVSSPSDLDRDGDTDGSDLLIFADEFGQIYNQ